MSVNNPYQQYQQSSVNTATPGELTLMLYNGALKFLKQAKIAVENKQIGEANEKIIRVQDIIAELMGSLNMEIEISKNMYALYDFMNNRLIDANINKDVKALEEVEGLLVEMRDTWKEVIKLNKKGMKTAE
ncbi:flagellar protein FliS [Desulfitispora alkaliphila]|uniref:flagellar export chaperone FliS n=1 Tax=Desulfitispora alkaliphila TaxID=622674 RepID=UPI003D19A12B